MYEIPVIPGDGIGPEIINEGKKVIESAAATENFNVEWKEYPYGAEHYLETGETLPESALKELSQYDAIYMGSVGDPRVEPGVLEKGILLKLRFYFDQYVNLRPVKLLPGVECPLREPGNIDFTVIRENTEDFYVGVGGRAKKGKTKNTLEIERKLYNLKFDLDIESDSDEIAYQLGVISEEGAKRVTKYAFDHAQKRKDDRVTAVDKANVLSDIYGFWRQKIEEISEEYPEIEHEFNYVDAATMWFVKNPEWYQTIVTPNMFGDIITDLGAMIQGGLGLAPGGNINPEGTSMFEPIHGSAPKHAGENKVNPIATIWAGALLLDHLGEQKAKKRIVKAISQVLEEGKIKTYDLGGNASTTKMGDAIAERVKNV
ncbi:MAG: Isocitrate/isopropylmalate dehydrogenase LeuB [Candidatus Methanohalarchaeum thermophilum]|uniref:Isocitrate/isopropylmalate dehydrogenase LeuB n=1 Tax=Methanohalarchaeum thermophilum TaxID=1903181 RepID=A0A1Q6DT69_METT1|nr:MAG: Isocitrate/isopropylmalate dehydrogenase LeuB [Candidatus Methanohalarchaeum thermophilum]